MKYTAIDINIIIVYTTYTQIYSYWMWNLNNISTVKCGMYGHNIGVIIQWQV